jgi:hypothetical protein
MNEDWPRVRFSLMVLTLLALLAGLWAGLLRLGWRWPVLQPDLPIAHGPLMVSGVLGTLIGLERAVALNRPWTYAAPLLTGLGALALVVGLSGWAGPLLITLGSLGLMAVFVVIVRRQPALFTVTMGLGTLVWLIGNGLWLMGWPIYRVALWWGGFLVLTIAGERLELARLLRLPGRVRAAFLATASLFLAGLIVMVAAFDLGVRLTAVGMIALAVWLLRYDIARHTLRKTGLSRFIAVCMLSGYVWLGASGLMGLTFGGVAAGPHYDAVLHALFLGFVFSMIFGHAPIILPAVLKVPLAFSPTFYVPLLLLHLSLLLRVVGDLTGWIAVRQWAGLINVVVLLLFLANTVRAARSPTHVADPKHGRKSAGQLSS